MHKWHKIENVRPKGQRRKKGTCVKSLLECKYSPNLRWKQRSSGGGRLERSAGTMTGEGGGVSMTVAMHMGLIGVVLTMLTLLMIGQ